jgi:hypothetical protein
MHYIGVFLYTNSTFIAEPAVYKSVELVSIATVYNFIIFLNLVIADQNTSIFSSTTQITRCAPVRAT